MYFFLRLRSAYLFFIIFSFAGLCSAQNTSTVFSPDVDAGESEVEYRVGYEPDGERFAHRFHYQYGFNEQWRMRLIGLQSRSATANLEFRYLRWEGMWQFVEDEESGWDSAIRTEVQIAEGDNLPSRVRLGWTSKVALNDDWELRSIFLAGREIGAGSGNGVLLEYRGQVKYKLNSQFSLSLDLFSDFNRTGSIGRFDDQEHQIGPLLSFKLGDGWSGSVGYLSGLSDAAPNDAFRFAIIWSL